MRHPLAPAPIGPGLNQDLQGMLPPIPAVPLTGTLSYNKSNMKGGETWLLQAGRGHILSQTLPLKEVQ